MRCRKPDICQGRSASERISRYKIYEIRNAVVEISYPETNPIVQYRLLESKVVTFADFRQQIWIGAK